MGRNVWDPIKLSKNFYVRTYRTTGNLLVISFSIMLCLIGLIMYNYMIIKPIDFYATNSQHHPILLHSMDHPNYSSQALLENDVHTDRKPTQSLSTVSY